jgi:aerobic carbon-monoxide dehydrogenase large subunit
MPSFETDRTETPSPVNSMGVKGVGEAGTIASSPTIVNAVIDALRPLGIDYIDMPVTPLRVWQTIQAAQGAGDGPRASEQGVDPGDRGGGASGAGPAGHEGGAQ